MHDPVAAWIISQFHARLSHSAKTTSCIKDGRGIAAVRILLDFAVTTHYRGYEMVKGQHIVLTTWLLLLALHAGAEETAPASDAFVPFIVVEAYGKTLKQAAADLKRAIDGNNYVYIREQTLDSRLVPQSQENPDILIIYFCNFGMLDKALKLDKRVGIFLPCRVTLIRGVDSVRMIAVNPKFISKSLGDARLAEICKRLADDYQTILNEASL